MNAQQEITVKAFMGLFNLKFKVESVQDNPYMLEGMPAGSLHYRCRIRMYPSENPKQNRRQMTVYYSKGPALTRGVELDEVLDTLAMDGGSIAAVNSAEEWANDFGMEYTREVERAFNATVRQGDKLVNLFGEHWTETLLYHTQRR